MQLKSVLLIDDDQLLGSLISGLTKPFGINLIQAMNGFHGLKLASEYKFDFIFVDLMLPQVDGLNVIRLLKGQPKRQNTRLIAISGRCDPLQQATTLEAGADVFLAKPVDPLLLKRALGVTT